MPRITPTQKIEATRNHGGQWMNIRLEGDTFDETARLTHQFCEETGATLIHPFDDLKVIEGQGTVSLEISNQMREMRRRLGAVITAVGGGGLLAGTILTMRETNPDALIIGVEPEGADCMAQSIAAGHPFTLPHIDTFVDGAAVARPGDLTFEIVSQAIAEGRVRLLKISKNQLCATMADMLQIDGIIAEPAGALSVAALEQVVPWTDDDVVSVISGGNFDMRRMPKILQHADLYRRTKVFVSIILPDRPRALAELLQHLDPALEDLNICYMNYDDEPSVGNEFPLTVGFESKHGKAEEIQALVAALDAHNYSYRELSEKPA